MQSCKIFKVTPGRLGKENYVIIPSLTPGAADIPNAVILHTTHGAPHYGVIIFFLLCHSVSISSAARSRTYHNSVAVFLSRVIILSATRCPVGGALIATVISRH